MIGLILLSCLVAASLNYSIRASQYKTWQKFNEIYYLEDGTPLFTTTDAPYFLGIAQDLKKDGEFNTFYKNQAYSYEKKQLFENKESKKIRDAPLLSVIISLIASDSDPKSLLEAGHKLILVTSILTSVMIIIAFGAAGYWLEGAVAAAGGGLSLAFLPRSGAGRIDTDQLNLGFFYLITGLIIFMARAKSFWASVILASLTGATFWIFDWWYSKPFFGWAFLIGFIWLSLVCKVNIKRFFCQLFLFLAFSGLPLKGIGVTGDSSYLVDVISFEGLVFPNTFDTITELSKVSLLEIFEKTSGSVWVAFLSVIGLGMWALVHPALAIVFGPAVMFAFLNFLIGNRAIFYSAPIVWFGFAWVTLLVFRWIEFRLKFPYPKIVFLTAGLITCFSTIWLFSPTNYLQSPTFNKNTVNNFRTLKDILPGDDVAIVSWWDYGYMSMFMNGFPTIHDGGVQTTPATYLIANNLLRSNQKIAAIELQILADKGYGEVLKFRQMADDKFDGKITIEKKSDTYLVLTADMARWMGSISKIGSFDIETGKPYQFSQTSPTYTLFYENLTCKPTDISQEFRCNGQKLNLERGEFGNQAILYGASVSKSGKQTAGKRYPNANTPFVVHSELAEGASHSMLMHRDLYFSVFHQLFYLNRADPKYFELVYDGFPDMRVFKVL